MTKGKPVAAGATPLAAIPEAETKDGERMTARQAAVLRELCALSGEPFDGGLTRAQAERRIEHLKSEDV